MALLDKQDISLSGTILTYSSAETDGDTFRNDRNTNLYIKNTSDGSRTVTIVAQRKCNQGFLHEQDITLDAGEEKVVADIEPGRFNDEDGIAHLSYDDESGVEVAVARN